jgi:hypothetical protein
MFQLTVGLFIVMYLVGVISEEAGIVPNTRLERLERQEQARLEQIKVENER